MASSEKISVYNIADLKNTSDDALPNYLNSLGFAQSHTLADIRLALGYAAFLVAAACFGWDYQYGFEATKYYTAAAVALYAALNTVLSPWIAFVESGIVYQGYGKDGSKISITTSTKKNTPIYDVKIVITSSSSSSSAAQTLEFSRPFSEWFDVQGRFIAAPFQTVFATSVPAIGKADPKRVATAAAATATETTTTTANGDYSPEVLDAIMASQQQGVAAEATGADTGKKSKRRKA